MLKQYTSFSTDLQVSKQCRGNQGLIIGLNMKQMHRFRFSKIIGAVNTQCGMTCCDVSWISKYKNEKEVLVSKYSLLPILENKIFDIQEGSVVNQYVISTPYDDKTSTFEKFFLQL